MPEVGQLIKENDYLFLFRINEEDLKYWSRYVTYSTKREQRTHIKNKKQNCFENIFQIIWSTSKTRIKPLVRWTIKLVDPLSFPTSFEYQEERWVRSSEWYRRSWVNFYFFIVRFNVSLLSLRHIIINEFHVYNNFLSQFTI